MQKRVKDETDRNIHTERVGTFIVFKESHAKTERRLKDGKRNNR